MKTVETTESIKLVPITVIADIWYEMRQDLEGAEEILHKLEMAILDFKDVIFLQQDNLTHLERQITEIRLSQSSQN